MSVGTNIKNRRNDIGMSQDELAKLVGYKTRSSIAKIENGETVPSSFKLKKIAEVLNVQVEDILGEEKKNTSKKTTTSKKIKKNAIILAAGKSNRFAPFTYEKPKGLFRVKGEVLIERQIEQLLEAGVEDIYVVIGYMKEKFFYLEQKYPQVHLLINNTFGSKGNIMSLYVAREYFGNTYICCADHYFTENLFLDNNTSNLSYRACMYFEGKFREFAVKKSDADIITDVQIGGHNSLGMTGHAYMNKNFSKTLRYLMEKEIDDFGVSSMFWEEFFAKHMKELTFYVKEFKHHEIREFDDIDDLREFDSEFLLNVDSDIITNIQSVLKCEPEDIKDIAVINAGLTNVLFYFTVKGKEYVYRHPGGTADTLIDRRTEVYLQNLAKKLGIDDSIIYIDPTGWKLSYYIKGAKNCDFEASDRELKIACEYLHKLHKAPSSKEMKIFDNLEEGKKLMRVASRTKGNLFREFEDMMAKLEKLYGYVKKDAKRLGYKLVPCHNDVYDLNFVKNDKGKVYLIDWEYGGMNYEANDILGIITRYDWSDAQIERYLRFYFGREMTADERRFYFGFYPISTYYWMCWGLYKGSVGEEDGFFFLQAYRNIMKRIDAAIESYEVKR